MNVQFRSKWFFACALLAAVLVLLLFTFQGTESGKKFYGNEADTGQANAKALAGGTGSVKTLAQQRQDYGVSPSVFALLPQPPEDFNSLVSLYRNTGKPDESLFSQKYYLQPEFYPSFIESGLPYWTNPSRTHWAAYGYGSYPVKKQVNAQKGSESSFSFFVHSGYGVRSYQGMALNAIVQFPNGSTTTLALQELLLEPNFPAFRENWARKITVDFTPQQAGVYTIKVFASRPSAENSAKWSALAASGNTPYFDAGFIDMQKPLIEVALEVE